MGLQIKNETVYVIYRNGKPYEAKGRKLVYTTKGAAKQVITNDAQEEARRRYDNKRRESNYDIPSWWDLSFEEQEALIDEVRAEFEVVEYVPKRKQCN